MKFLLLLLVIAVFVLMLKPKLRAPGHGSARKASPRSTEIVVECAHCGVHLPDAEAIRGARGQVYCCEAHRITAEGSR
jgi:uncharacterized protein